MDAIPRAAAAAGALGDPALIQFVQLGLVQLLARTRQRNLDRSASVALLQTIGASAAAQRELASAASSPTAAAYALTVAVGEAALASFDGADAPPDVFGAAFERAHGAVTAKLTTLDDKLGQVKEAFDADLITEAEMLTLRERVLATGIPIE